MAAPRPFRFVRAAHGKQNRWGFTVVATSQSSLPADIAGVVATARAVSFYSDTAPAVVSMRANLPPRREVKVIWPLGQE